MSKTRDLANLADLNFDSGTMVVDKANDRVGIGTTSPDAPMTIQRPSNNQGVSSGISLKGQDGTTQGGLGTDGVNDNAVQLVANQFIKFHTNNTDGTTNEAARIDSSQNFLVGTTSAPTTLISATSGGGIALDPDSYSAWNREATSSTQAHLILNQTGVDAQYLQFRKDGTTVGSIGTNGTRFYLAGSGRGIAVDESAYSVLPVNTSGSNNDGGVGLGSSSARFSNLYLSGGVYLGGTGSANKLDDYEEGTWNPTTFSGWSTDPVISSATYTRVGRLVMVTILFTSGVSSSDARFTNGLPFTVSGQGTGAGVTGSLNDFGHVMISGANTWFTNDGGNFANTRWSATYTTS